MAFFCILQSLVGVQVQRLVVAGNQMYAGVRLLAHLLRLDQIMFPSTRQILRDALMDMLTRLGLLASFHAVMALRCFELCSSQGPRTVGWRYMVVRSAVCHIDLALAREYGPHDDTAMRRRLLNRYLKCRHVAKPPSLLLPTNTLQTCNEPLLTAKICREAIRSLAPPDRATELERKCHALHCLTATSSA